MRVITLNRFGYLPTHTPGMIIYGEPDVKYFATMEPPWRYNQDNTSCIPEGHYHARRFTSPKRGVVWQLDEVPQRENIQIHILNFARQTEGCIGLGLRHAIIDGEPAIADSALAVQQFNVLLIAEDEIEIVIEYRAPARINMADWL